jgi:hypothetical protein
MALTAKKFWGGNKARGSNRSFSTRDYRRDSLRYNPRPSSRTSSGPKEMQKARTCYSCGDKSHFVADYHFEKREDIRGKLVYKDKYKSLSEGYTKYSSNSKSSDKNAIIKKPREFLAHEEYSSDDDEKSSNKE